jgi:flavin-dependent dehydrogenase
MIASTSKFFLDDNQSFCANYLIGEDGVLSIIRSQLSKSRLSKNKWRENLATAFEVFIDRSTELEDFHSPIIYFGYLKFGYCWIFPNIERIICGIGDVNVRNHEFVSIFKSFLGSFHFADKYISHIKSAFIPMGGVQHIPVTGNVALIGDADGFCESIYWRRDLLRSKKWRNRC